MVRTLLHYCHSLFPSHLPKFLIHRTQQTSEVPRLPKKYKFIILDRFTFSYPQNLSKTTNCGVPLIVREILNYAGYLGLCGVSRIISGTSICAGYLESCRVPRIVRGTTNYAGYLESCLVPQIVLELFHLLTRGALLPFLFFP